VITTNQATTQTQADDLKQKWRDIVTSREPVIFPNGTVLQPIVGNAQQAQLIEARTWNAQMCADAVGVPGWKLGLNGPSMTYQNIEDADIDWVRDSVDRYGQPITQTLSKWLLPGGTDLVWDYASRMRADANQTAQFLALLVTSNIITEDEARAALNRPPKADAGPAQTPPQAGNTTGGQAAALASETGLPAAPLQITAGVES
jgi:HK97 family phage portal protein